MKFLTAFLFLILIGCESGVSVFTIKGHSMEPTIPNGAKVEVDFSYYHPFNEPRVGDVVVYKFQTKDELYIKRIVGMPGEKIDVDTKRIIFGNRIIEDDLTTLNKQMAHYNYVLPPQAYLVIGDGETSIDSKKFGFLPREYILGKVMRIVDKPTKEEQYLQRILDARVVGEQGIKQQA